MYLKKFEYFILDSSVAGTLLLIALAIRIEAINAGFDQFSSNIIFISVFIISTGLYISMQIALYEIIIYLCHHSKSLSTHKHLNDSVIAPEQTFMEYEKLRSNTITEQKRTNDKKLELVHTYIHQTMAAYISQENLQRLCAYISDFFQNSKKGGPSPCTASGKKTSPCCKYHFFNHFKNPSTMTFSASSLFNPNVCSLIS